MFFKKKNRLTLDKTVLTCINIALTLNKYLTHCFGVGILIKHMHEINSGSLPTQIELHREITTVGNKRFFLHKNSRTICNCNHFGSKIPITIESYGKLSAGWVRIYE